MYDIAITKNGSLYLSDRDITWVSYEQYIAQIIYNVLMAIPSDLLSGISNLTTDIMFSNIKQYILNQLSQYSYININKVEISLNNRLSDIENLNIDITYMDTSPDGLVVDYHSDFNFDIKSGIVSDLYYENKNIAQKLTDDTIEVYDYIIVNKTTRELELSVTPQLDISFHYTQDPIYLLNGDTGYSLTTNSKTAVVETDGNRKLYRIDNYIDDFNSEIEVVQKITSISLSDPNMYVKITEKFGNLCILTDNIGTITIDVQTVKALQFTREVTIDDTAISENICPLKGYQYYTALFPKDILPGTYLLYYKGLRS
jgi:hypothetical protein